MLFFYYIPFLLLYLRHQGLCFGLTKVCSGSEGWLDPDLSTVSAYEEVETLSDGLDNDCDGQTDEGVINACGECGPVPEETCNGADDDCDGFVDEGVSNACGGCGAAGDEQCNGVDDDCDGTIDEELTPPADLVCPDVGVCASSGPAVCRGASGFGCGTSPLFEREETQCDFQDNDCDGAIDEGLRNQCDFCGPQPIEACNHLDADCDGEEDEGCTVDPNSQAIREP